MADVVMNTVGTAVGVGLLLVLPTRLGRVSSADEPERQEQVRPPGTEPATGIARLLGPSELAPVVLDLRRVFWAGIALWGVALVVAAVLIATGHAQTRLLWICLTGVALGLLALLWERRRQARIAARQP